MNIFELLEKLDYEAAIRRGPNDKVKQTEKVNAVITSPNGKTLVRGN